MNANIQIQKKGTYLIDICGFHLDYMKGPFSQISPKIRNSVPLEKQSLCGISYAPKR